MDSATKIFETIVAGGEAGLLRMIADKQTEHQLLDFKASTKDLVPLHDNDKRNLAKTVGGFANADGGVIVWGVKCNKNAAKLDVVSELKPIAQVEQFKTALDEVTPQLVQPFPDVRHVLIEGTTAGSGYIATCVPSWDGLPVRSTMTERGSDFYLRTGNLTLSMPHSLLAERFGRRPLPKLRLTGYVVKEHAGAVTMKLAVHNSGRGLAKSITVILPPGTIVPASSLTWSVASGYENSEEPFVTQGVCYEADASLVIYPHLGRQFYRLYATGSIMEEIIQKPIEYQVFCDGYTYKGAIKAVQFGNDANRFVFEEVDETTTIV